MMLRAARTVVVLGVVLQLVGFAKLLVVAAYFGAGPVLDAYYLAQVIPSFLTSLSSGVLQSSVIPNYVSAKSRRDDVAAVRLRNAALTWAATLLVGAAAFLCLLRHATVQFLWAGIDPIAYSALQPAFALLMWVAPLNGLADAMAMVLNVEGSFALAAAAPTVNAIVSAVIVAVWHDAGIHVLIWSLLVGIASQLLLVAFALIRRGIRLRPIFTLPPELPRTLTVIAIPVLLSNVLGNFGPAFMQVIASRAGTGAVSAMGYATRLHNSLVQAIVMSVSIVLLPHFARLIAEQRRDELRLTHERLFCATLLFSLALLAFIAVGGQAAVGILLQRGRFTPADSELVASIWLALTTGLMGMTWGTFLVRYFQARQRPWIVAILTVVWVVINIAMALILLPRAGIMGIALANSIAYTVFMLLFQHLASRELGAIVNSATRMFAVRALLINAAGYAGALIWSMALKDAPVVLVLAGQLLIIVAMNLLVVRAPPLSVPVRALWRR